MVIARKQTLVQLSDELIAALDARAAREGKSRSALIREAVQEHLHDEIEAEIGRQIVEGYTRLPQTDEEMEWGDAMAADVFQWLDEEDGGWDEEDQGQ